MPAQGADKQVKLSVAVDGRSFDQAKAALRDLTSLAQNFVRTLNSAGGGLFGGASGKTISSAGGGIGAPGRMAQAVGQAGGGGSGIASPLVAVVQANKSILQSASTESKAAFRVMSDGLRGAIRDQSQEIDKLQAKLRSLGETYQKLSTASREAIASGAGGSESQAIRQQAMGKLQREIIEGTAALGGAQKSLADLQAMDSNPYQGIFGRGGRNRRRLAEAIRNSGEGDFEEYNEYAGTLKPKGFLTGLPNRLGMSGWGVSPGTGFTMSGLMGAMGMGMAGAAIMSQGMQSVVNRDNAISQYTITEGMRANLARASHNQAYGNLGMQIKGNANMALAASSITATDLAGALGKDVMNAYQQQALAAAGLGNGVDSVKRRASNAVGGAINSIVGGDNPDIDSAQLDRMTRDVALADLTQKGDSRLNTLVQSKYQQQNLQDQADREYFQGSYMSRISSMRAYGSNKKVRIGNDENGNPTYGNAAELSGVGTLYDSAEINGMRMGIRSSLGSRYSGAAEGMLNWQYGGLGNAMQLYGGAIGYGAGPGAFMSSLMRRGSIAEPVVGSVGAAYQAQMMGGNMFTGGGAGMEGVLATVAAMGGDQRAGRAAESGLQAYGSYASGGVDRLQQGINVLASVQAAGSGKLYEQEALRNMSPAQRMDIMRRIQSGEIKSDADLPDELRMQGVTIDSLKAYGQAQDKYMFARYQSSQGTDEVNEQVAAFRKSGFASLDNIKSPKDLRQAFKRLGVAGMQSGLGKTVDEATAFLMQRAATEDPALFKALKRSGIGVDVSGVEGAQKANADAELQRREANIHAKAGEQVVASQGKSAQDTGKALVNVGQNFNAEVGIAGRALADFTGALNDATRSIRTGQPMRTRAPGKKPE